MEELCNRKPALSGPGSWPPKPSEQSATPLAIERSIAAHLATARSLEASARLALNNVVRLEERVTGSLRQPKPYLAPFRFCFNFLNLKIVRRNDRKVVEPPEDAEAG